MYCLGHHPEDLILLLNDFLVPVRSLLPLAMMFPRAPLAQTNVETSHSPKLISELLLWSQALRLHLGSQIFRGAFDVCEGKRPCMPGWGHQEGHLGVVLTSPALPLAVFSSRNVLKIQQKTPRKRKF